MNAEKIAVYVPTRGAVYYNTVFALNAIRDVTPGLRPWKMECGTLSVSSVRNTIVRDFLATDAEILIQIDDDLIPHPDLLHLADPIEAGDADVVGAPYLIFRPEIANGMPFPCAFTWIEGRGFAPLARPFGRRGLHPCDGIGTGSLAVHRRVFEHPEMDAPFDYATDEFGRMTVTDDLNFFLRLKKHAPEFRVLADFDRQADHCPNTISLAFLQQGFTKAYQLARVREREMAEQASRVIVSA